MRRLMRRICASTLAALTVMIAAVWWGSWAQPMRAYAGIGRDVVSRHAVVIPAGEKAEDVLVIGNNATVSGTVTDTIVVLQGTVHLTSTARVDTVINVGGQVTEDPGAHVGAVYTLAFTQPFLNSLSLGVAMVVALWAVRLALSAALVAVPTVLALLVQARLHAPVSYLEKSVRRTGLTGLLATVGAAILCAITAIIIIGLPVTAVLLLLYTLVGCVGLTCVSYWLGGLTKIGRVQDGPIWLKTLVGATFMMAFGNIPVVGPVLLMVAWLVGIGCVTAWLWQRWSSRKSGPSSS
ncbi:hypothetical protein [Alicyclobacillus contaminans]|uniref:hypothetical protein n=1 Tax=Alicyclobacillus contaminans TaxID=392016 RepID=UPI0003FA83A4|nr:hypothetical protein [Alicyclobacillus contaminans]